MGFDFMRISRIIALCLKKYILPLWELWYSGCQDCVRKILIQLGHYFGGCSLQFNPIQNLLDDMSFVSYCIGWTITRWTYETSRLVDRDERIKSLLIETYRKRICWFKTTTTTTTTSFCKFLWHQNHVIHAIILTSFLSSGSKKKFWGYSSCGSLY